MNASIHSRRGAYYAIIREGGFEKVNVLPLIALNTVRQTSFPRENDDDCASTQFTTVWSNKANAQGQLVRQSSADSEIIVKADGFYCSYLYEYNWSRFEGSYDNSSSSSYSNGYYHTYSESEQTTEISVQYTSEMTTNRHSNGGAFYLVSFEGSASGSGSNTVSQTSNSNSEKYNISGDSYDYGDYGYFYSYYNDESNESCSESCREIAYDYTADWSWNVNGTALANVVNHITGSTDDTSTGSWSCGWGSNYQESSGYSCIDSCSYGYSYDYSYDCGYGTDNYDEVISRTGWGKGQPMSPFYGVRWSPFSGEVSEYSYSYDCGEYGCNYDYSYNCAYFYAPGFSASLYEETHSNDDGIIYYSGSGSASSGQYGWIPTSNIPASGGVYYNNGYNYYDDYYYYYDDYYYGCGYGVPSGPQTWRTMGVSALTVSQPGFGNYTTVDVNDCLPALPKHAPEPLIAETEPKIGGVWDTFKTIGTAAVDGAAAGAKATTQFVSNNLDSVQLALDVVGFVPVIGMGADLVNTVISAGRGNWGDAGINAVAIVPGIGDSVKAGSMAASAIVVAVKHGDEAIDAGKTVAQEVKTVGQLHHPISKNINEALMDSKNISPEFQKKYREFVTRAIDKDAHIGYQKWHRELDDQIVKKLQGNTDITQEEFVDLLKEFYKDPDIARRFPDFVRDLETWLKSLL